MKGLATILRETDINQVIGRLARFDPDTGELEGKCALGVISCEVGLILHRDGDNWPEWREIMMKAKVPEDLRGDGFIPTRQGTTPDGFDNLQTYIVELNDHCKLTFKEIADCIETTFPEESWSK